MVAHGSRKPPLRLAEEIEVINAIYGEGTLAVRNTSCRSIYCILHFDGQATSYNITFPGSYPRKRPRVTGIDPNWMESSPRPKEREIALGNALNEVFVPGAVCMFDAIESIRDCLVSPERAGQAVATTTESIGVPSRVDIDTLQGTKECAACLDDMIVPDLAELGCKHYLCAECMNVGLQASMRSKTPFTCCRRYISIALIKDFCILARHELYDYETILLERSTKNPLYCSHPRCSRFIRPDHIHKGADEVRCARCKTSTCVHCRRGKHFGICRENKHIQEVIGMLQAKFCPSCNHLIYKDGGCKNMACRCGYLFCWLCGKERVNSGPGCGCSLYS